MRRFALVVVFALSTPGSGSAQLSGPYRISLVDTVDFHEVSTSTVEIETPQGPIVAGSVHDARIRVVATGPNSLEAWYQALEVGSRGPAGDVRPPTDALLNLRYKLRVTPDGGVETEEAPTSPAPIQEITDLTHQFDDFFIRVPWERPAMGVTWADTVSSDTSGLPETTQLHVAIRTYTARGDTTVNGVPGQVIEMSTSVILDSTSPMQGQPGLTITTTLFGSEAGLAVFDWARGRLLLREKTGELSGTFRIDAPQPLEMQQVMKYESRLESS